MYFIEYILSDFDDKCLRPIENFNSEEERTVIQVGFLSGLSMFSPGQALLSIGDKKKL